MNKRIKQFLGAAALLAALAILTVPALRQVVAQTTSELIGEYIYFRSSSPFLRFDGTLTFEDMQGNDLMSLSNTGTLIPVTSLSVATGEVRLNDIADGIISMVEATQDPSTTDLSADAEIAFYTKADKLVFAYNNSGTITYITIPLDASSTGWTNSTTAP